MRVKVRIVVAAAALAGLAALPSSAGAAEGCLYGTDKAGSKNLFNIERSLLCLTNAHRVRNDVKPLLRDTRLSKAARAHSADMAARGFFEHTTPEGLDPSARAAAAGYPGGAGENIATTSEGTVFALFELWRTSTQGHNENMLNPNYRAAGFGVDPHCCPSGFAGITGTQMFGFAEPDTKDDALDLYASSNSCAKAKLSLIRLRKAVKKAKGARKAELRARKRSAARKVDRLCKDP
jgi:uncharacterized protein YkwD